MISSHLSLHQIDNLKSAIELVTPVTITMPGAILLEINHGLQIYRPLLDQLFDSDFGELASTE
jgi:hypothetical protein